MDEIQLTAEEENVFYRPEIDRQPLAVDELDMPTLVAEMFKMRLPHHLDIISRENDSEAVAAQPEETGFELLPLYNTQAYNDKKQDQYRLSTHEALTKKWEEYTSEYTVTTYYKIKVKVPVSDPDGGAVGPAPPTEMPKARDVRFECQKVVCPGCKDKMCGKNMPAGPEVDEAGPAPVPGDLYDRYRKKLNAARARRAKKPWK